MKEDSSRVLMQWLVPAGCMVVIVCIMFFNFFTRTKTEAVNSFEREMMGTVDEYAVKVHHELDRIRTVGVVAGESIYATGEVDPKTVREVTNSIVEYTPAYEAIYYIGGGEGINHKGKRVNLTDYTAFMEVSEANVVNYQYVKMDGPKNEIKDSLQIVIPLNENEPYKLLIYYPMERFKNITKMGREFESEAFSVLMDINGNIIKSSSKESKFLQNDNIFSSLPGEYKNEITKARVQMMNRMNGCIEAKIDGEKRILVYAPVGINDWVVVAGVAQSYVEAKEMMMWKHTSMMMYQLLGVIVFFAVIFIVANLFIRRKTEERDRLLREKADTDLLTGLSNKLATERKIKEYMQKYPNSLGMMFVLDIDNFKKINDTMGHAFGDEVLRSLGKQVSSVFRVTDIVGRSGGDEFTIFLKFLKDDANTLKEAQKLVNFFKDFVAGEYVKYSATASIGAAVFPTHGSDFETLYKSADKALYKAKQRGKNQLAFFDDRDRTEAAKEVVTEQEKELG